MKLKTWPIVAGVLVDVAASLVIGLVYAIALVVWQVVQGLGPDEEVFTGPHFTAMQVLGLLCTVLGGFVAARVANVLPVQYGLAVGVTIMVAGLILEMIAPEPQLSKWHVVLLYLCSVPAGALGGYLASGRTGSTAALSDS